MVATTPSSRTIPWYLRLDLPTLLPSLVFALLMVWTVVQSIGNANWANGLQVLVLVALPGVLVGALFARLTWLPGWLAHLLSVALGVAWSVQRVGPLLINEIGREFSPVIAARLVTWSDKAS